jgi:hypothetical protein
MRRSAVLLVRERTVLILPRERGRAIYQERQTGMTGKQSAEFPNMAQRAVMQYLSLDDWKVAARLPIPAGELMLSTIRQSSSPRRGSRRCGRPFETSRLVELERRRRNDITGRKDRSTVP